MAVYTVTADAEQFTCNAYLATGDRPTLVDAGAMPGVVDVVREYVDDVDAVVLTHQHHDHVEQLDAVVEAFDPAVYAHADHPHRTQALADGDDLRVGDETLQAVYTPGHATDHVALLGERTLFSGDVVVHDDGAFADGSFGRTDIPGADRETLIDSLGTLLDRMGTEVEDMYAGHGGTFHGDVRAVVERALGRAKRREPKYPE
ncbi:MAG: MBL fold metallo-hydrolase [Halobacteriaceae archaeon]